MYRSNRNLANTNESIAGQLIDYGTKVKKEYVLKDVILQI